MQVSVVFTVPFYIEDYFNSYELQNSACNLD